MIRSSRSQSFGDSGGVEVAVGGNEYEHAQAVGGPILVEVERGCQLHGVVGAKPVRVRQRHGVVHQRGRDLLGQIPACQMLAEPRED